MMILLLFSVELAFADDASQSEKQIYYQEGDNRIYVQEVDSGQYLFLPSSADISNLTLCLSDQNLRVVISAQDGDLKEIRQNETNSGQMHVNLSSLQKSSDGRYAVSVSLYRGEDEVVSYPLFIMAGNDIDTLYFNSVDPNSAGRSYIDSSKSNRAAGTMRLASADGTNIYNGGVTEIKARGASSFAYYPKKSYQIKLEKKTSLVTGASKGKTWCLLASFNDPLKMNDKLAKDIANYTGDKYSARESCVNLYYDGEYRGVYLLSEKNQIKSNRIDIFDMEDMYEEADPSYGEDIDTRYEKNDYGNIYYYQNGLTTPGDFGGYLLEFNGVSGDEANWFKLSGIGSNPGIAVNIKSPELSSRLSVKYISEYFQAFQDAITAVDDEGNHTGRNPSTGLYYYDYCDLDSLVNTYLLQTIASNNDAFYRSQFFYKDRNGIMYSGPIWDMDLTFGTGWMDQMDPNFDYLTHGWANSLIQIPSFQNKVKNKYFDVYQEVLASLVETGERWPKFVDTAADLKDNIMMDEVLWPLSLQAGSPYAMSPNKSYQDYISAGEIASYRLWDDATTYEDIVAYRVDWLTQHKRFLDKYFEAMGSTDAHIYGVATPASTTTHVRKCIDCDATISEPCKFQVTGESNGIQEKTCIRCGNKIYITVEQGNGNSSGGTSSGGGSSVISPGGGSVVVPGTGAHTCTYDISDNGDGTHTKICKICGKQVTEKCAWSEGETVAISASDCGKTTQVCQECGATRVEKVTLDVGAEFSKGHRYRCTAKDKTVTLVKGKGSKTTVVPSTVAYGGITYKVGAVGSSAFKSNKIIRTIKLGQNVSTIGANAFRDCKKLTKVVSTKNVRSIGAGAFQGDMKLKKVTNLSGCLKIASKAFCGDKALRTIGSKAGKVKLNKKVVVGKHAFKKSGVKWRKK